MIVSDEVEKRKKVIVHKARRNSIGRAEQSLEAAQVQLVEFVTG
jgi:hypothetical protein